LLGAQFAATAPAFVVPTGTTDVENGSTQNHTYLYVTEEMVR
jgi:hypothetical protein